MAYETLHDRLKGPINEALKKELGITNDHAVPKLDKVVINVGINKSKLDSKEMQAYIQEVLSLITGQRPVATKARLSISNFKIREGMIVGSMVTLRGKQMEDFLDRLISYTLPRIRDFQGLKKKLDGHGNYAIGIKDHSIFPEVPPVDAGKIFGFQIQISTTAETDEQALALLKQIGMPFKPEKKAEESKSEATPEVKPEEPKKEEKAEKKEEPATEAEEDAPASDTSTTESES